MAKKTLVIRSVGIPLEDYQEAEKVKERDGVSVAELVRRGLRRELRARERRRNGTPRRGWARREAH